MNRESIQEVIYLAFDVTELPEEEGIIMLPNRLRDGIHLISRIFALNIRVPYASKGVLTIFEISTTKLTQVIQKYTYNKRTPIHYDQYLNQKHILPDE